MIVEIVQAIGREFPIDALCGSPSLDDVTQSKATGIWSFHGDADQTVPVATSRERMATLRKAGGHPIYTEYARVDHNSWQWAYTEPALLDWVFAQRGK